MSDNLLNEIKEKVENIRYDVPDEMFDSIWKGTIRKRDNRKWLIAALSMAAAAAAIFVLILSVNTKEDVNVVENENKTITANASNASQSDETGHIEPINIEKTILQTYVTKAKTEPSATVVDNSSETKNEPATSEISHKKDIETKDSVRLYTNPSNQVEKNNPIRMSESVKSQINHRKVHLAIAGAMPGIGDRSEYLFLTKRSVNPESATRTSFDEEPLPENTMDPFISYRVPVSLRFLVSGNISDCIYFEAGASYSIHSYLSSIDYLDVKQYQQLHFIGIPVGVRYNFLDYGRTSFYLRAGGAVEKCVSYTLANEDGQNKARLQMDPLFWSAEASLGAQVDIIGPLYLFAEGGASYHFANSTGKLTYYGSHPLMFSLQAGARIEIF